jgi:SAM-dependent methyltransferase
MDSNDDNIDDLIRAAMKADDPTGWFETVYARAQNGRGSVPWADMRPSPRLVEWANRSAFNGNGKRALVIGCGLGDDAEELARRGFEVVAFDIAPTAISWCKQRFPESSVDYQVCDLFNPPADWVRHFDFVLESRTLQALPWEWCEPAIARIVRFLAPGGTLLVLCLGRDPQALRYGIPWPLSRTELAAFEKYGLTKQEFEDLSDITGQRTFRVVFRKK